MELKWWQKPVRMMRRDFLGDFSRYKDLDLEAFAREAKHRWHINCEWVMATPGCAPLAERALALGRTYWLAVVATVGAAPVAERAPLVGCTVWWAVAGAVGWAPKRATTVAAGRLRRFPVAVTGTVSWKSVKNTAALEGRRHTGGGFDHGWVILAAPGLAITVGQLMFVLCSGLWVVEFVAFSVELTLCGESHNPPWMFFLTVVGRVV